MILQRRKPLFCKRSRYFGDGSRYHQWAARQAASSHVVHLMNKIENLIASTLLQNINAVPMSNNITLGFYRKAGVSTAANSKLNKRIGQHDFLFSTFLFLSLQWLLPESWWAAAHWLCLLNGDDHWIDMFKTDDKHLCIGSTWSMEMITFHEQLHTDQIISIDLNRCWRYRCTEQIWSPSIHRMSWTKITASLSVMII